MLAIMMPQGVGPRDMVLLPDDTTATEDGGSAAHPEKGLAYTRVRNSMTSRRQRTSDHDSPKVGESLENIPYLSVEGGIVQTRDGWGTGRVDACGGTILVNHSAEDRRTGFDETVPQRRAADGAGRT